MLQKTCALFIDTANISSKHAAFIIKKAKSYGQISLSLAYGDWSSPSIKEWYAQCIKHGIQLHQTTPIVKNKNANDMSLALDVMEAIHRKQHHTILIASSDSDFSVLAHRIKANNIKAVGIGDSKAAQNFQVIYSEYVLLPAQANKANIDKAKSDKPKPKAEAIDPTQSKAYTLLQNAVSNLNTSSLNSQGKINLSHLGKVLREGNPQFTYKAYGCSTLKKFVITYSKDMVSLFDLEHRQKAEPKKEKTL